VEGILRLLRQLASPGRLVLVATHDDRITQLADRVIELTPHLPDTHRRPTEVKLDAGDILFRQGNPSDLVYLVEEGEVEMVRELQDGEKRLAVIGPGNYFGELGPMLNLPRSATARAISASTLTSCTVQQFRSRQPGHGRSTT
jgi:putative ABC transport system ATP-binding protein